MFKAGDWVRIADNEPFQLEETAHPELLRKKGDLSTNFWNTGELFSFRSLGVILRKVENEQNNNVVHKIYYDGNCSCGSYHSDSSLAG